MNEVISCNICHKTSLSLLLLRPSPIAKITELAPNFANRVVSDSGLLAGLLPTTLPSQSRFVLRLLRPGYVYIYIEKPPVGVRNWLIYRVTDKSDIVPQTSDLFYLAQPEMTCSRIEHNDAALKLVNIPQAHKIPYIWLAFSANLWNEKSRLRNCGDPRVMQKIFLHDPVKNTSGFFPSPKNLRDKVLECALGKLIVDTDESNDFPFNSIVTLVAPLADTMKKAAANHPLTINKEVAIVLRDPVGIAAELNALRIRRNELIKKEINKPENLHPLNSSNTILGLRKSLVSEEDVDSYEQVAPLKTRKAFLKENYPVGTEWQELTEADRKELLKRSRSKDNELHDLLLLPYQESFKDGNLGRVIFPDHDDRAEAWTREKVDKNWTQFCRYYDEDARAKWVKDFNLRMKSLHYDPLRLFEMDWRTAAEDEQIHQYFKNHFDSLESFRPISTHNANLTYSSESHSIHTPAPFSAGGILQGYTSALAKDITDETSVALRAIVGNHAEMIDVIANQLLETSEKDGMRDKTYDVLKGISELKMPKSIMESHGWISNALAMFSFGHVSALSGAVFTLAADNLAETQVIPAMMAKLASFSKVQRFMEFAAQGALKSNAKKMPLLVTGMIDIDEALKIFKKRAGQGLGTSKSRIRAHRSGSRKIAISVLTDTDAYRAAGGNLAEIVHDPEVGTVKISRAATREAIRSAAGSAAIISEQSLLRLYEEEATAGAKIANLARSNVLHASEVLKTVDARLALGSMIIQAIGIWNARKKALEAQSDDKLMAAYFSLLDSGLGFLSGALQLWCVAAEATLIRVSGHAAAAASCGIGTLKFFGNLAGVAGSVVSLTSSIQSIKEQRNLHNEMPEYYYSVAAFAFGGTIATSTGLTVGSLAATLEARGIGGVVVRTVASRLAANAVVGTIGGVAFTVSGAGLILLATGVISTVSAIVLTPSEVQRWLGRSYFGTDGGLIFKGKRNDMFAKGDWASERLELDKIIKSSANLQG